MKIIIKLFTLIILTLFICLTVIPTALADDAATIDIGSVSADGTGYTYSDNKVTIDADGTYHITGTTTTNSIRVNSGVTADITFDNVSIDVGVTSTSAFDMNGATINLTLVGNNSLTSGEYRAGLEAPTGSVLTIFGDSTATLTAQGGPNSAGIGGGSNYAGGTITINGGDVTATGGDYGAGIGGGYLSAGGTTIISGGTVRATGGTDAAGIGGGMSINVYGNNTHGGTITITGGNVTANGSGCGAGIGGGYLGSSGTISISGGSVNATSGDVSSAAGAAGIGGGRDKGVDKITISGGNVIASALDYGAGIGGGSRGSGGIIEISDGSITATSRWCGAGIGGGESGNGGTITISGGIVAATSGYGGAGIGGGYSAAGGTINILGGDITSSGGMWGAGIGSGYGGNGGTITISSGTIKAYAGNYAAGIGAGGTNSASSHNGGTIRIIGGKVTARGGGSDMDAGLDIGRGRNGVNGTLSIDGAAQVFLGANGIDSSVTTLKTCILQGSPAGSLQGVYDNGTEIGGILIDVGNEELEHGTGYTVVGNSVTLTGGGNSYVLFGSTSSRNVVVQSGASADVTLFAADIQPASGCAFNMTAATVNMRLVGDNTLSSGVGFAGLQTTRFSSLTINGSGSLTSTGGTGGAGIGSGNGNGEPAGSITFSGGTVDATGSSGGAGIGGGSGGAGGTVLADGENTTVSATGGGDGYDIGSGSGNSSGGSLTVQNDAAVMMNRNGTNANASFNTGTVGGDGAGLLAGTYLNSQKLLTFSGVTASPTSGAKSFDDVTLTANVTGLSTANPQGQIAFFAGGLKIGQASLTRTADGSADATATIIWLSRGGPHTITAQYVQDDSDSYYMTNDGELADYDVAKIEQAPLIISGIPDTVTYLDTPFPLSISGGSGTGGYSYEVTGDAVSVADGDVTVDKAGQATITVTNVGDDNYLPTTSSVTITVNKATPPAVVFPFAGTITYEQELSDSTLTGGSGDGTFAWENPSTVPPVINTGYNVFFTPNDTDNYDYTGVELTKNVSIHVNKATPVVTFPTSEEITYEQPLSDSELTGGSGDGSFEWENPDTIPTVVNSGYRVIFTPDDTDNYLNTSEIVAITVQKAQQAAINVGGIPDTVTYGDSSFDLSGSGGSGIGDFNYSVTSGDAVSVSASGTVTVRKAGTAQITATKAGDDNYLPVSAEVTITVEKAIPIAVFPNASSLTYGQPLSASDLTGGSGDGSFEWENPDTVPTVINDGFDVVFTPSDTDNYLVIKQPVAIAVRKAAQAPLSVSGIPDILMFGDAPFELSVSGGSGSGIVSYAVTSGSAVSVDARGTVTILRSGTVVLIITKATDDYYLATTATIELSVRKATSPDDISAASAASVTPSAAPSPTVDPSPTATDASPSSTGSPVLLKPASIQADESTGMIIATIHMDDLPAGTASIMLTSGEIIQVDTTQSTLELPISQDDLNENGELVIIALDEENVPLGNYGIALTDGVWQQGITENGANSFSVFLWIATGALVVGIAIAITVMNKKKK